MDQRAAPGAHIRWVAKPVRVDGSLPRDRRAQAPGAERS